MTISRSRARGRCCSPSSWVHKGITLSGWQGYRLPPRAATALFRTMIAMPNVVSGLAARAALAARALSAPTPTTAPALQPGRHTRANQTGYGLASQMCAFGSACTRLCRPKTPLRAAPHLRPCARTRATARGRNDPATGLNSSARHSSPMQQIAPVATREDQGSRPEREAPLRQQNSHGSLAGATPRDVPHAHHGHAQPARQRARQRVCEKRAVIKRRTTTGSLSPPRLRQCKFALASEPGRLRGRAPRGTAHRRAWPRPTA